MVNMKRKKKKLITLKVFHHDGLEENRRNHITIIHQPIRILIDLN